MKPDNTLQGKIIGVGFQKTGTSSLRDALRIVGYTVGDTRYKLLFPILRKNWRKVQHTVDRYDAVEDNPYPIIYKELDLLYPGSKFILTLREPNSWYKSVTRHIGNLRDPMHEWIYGFGKGLPKNNKENTLDVYNNHNAGVIEYFKNRPDDLLIVDFTKGDGWEKLCSFLLVDIPDTPFPHANNAKKNAPDTSIKRKLKVRKKRIKFGIQVKYLHLFFKDRNTY